MFKHKGIFVAIISIITLAVLAVPSGALAKKNRAEVKGVITAVDTSLSTITISTKKAGSLTLAVDASTKIRKQHIKNATINDLAINDQVEVKYNTTTNVAQRIQAKPGKPAKVKLGKVEGQVTAVDLGASSVTIQPKNGAAVTVFADASTKIERNDQHATLADIQVGDHAEAKFDPQTFLASKIEAGANDDDNDNDDD
ncbi:MAG TPA: DUF5666 domain-containing protein [Anaerolineae bacterium]|nr:DUF5666 domain-containing protein [Anaerolineae bacterium]